MDVETARMAGVWIFLVIFVVTAIISLASLMKWVDVGDKKDALFKLLISEVILFVIAFVGIALREERVTPINIRELLLAERSGWESQYAERGWRTILKFDPVDDDKIRMVGETTAPAPGGGRRVPILEWVGEPFVVPMGREAIRFRATRRLTKYVVEIDPDMKWEFERQAGKGTVVEFDLELGPMFRGAVTDPPRAQPWGVVLTPGRQ
jgi:hypothetical protein